MEFVKYFDRATYKKHIGTVNPDESLTDQSFMFDADINVLVERYQNGYAPRTPVREPRYDMNNYETSNWTFEDWQNEKAMIERRFLHLTPEMREYFKSPQAFLEYCSNPDNYQLLDTGMTKKPDPVPEVPPVVEKGPEQKEKA